MSVEIPEDVYQRASEIARSQHLSVSDIIAAACSEHIAAWERIQKRRELGDRTRFLEVLSKVPDVEPDAHDRLE